MLIVDQLHEGIVRALHRDAPRARRGRAQVLVRADEGVFPVLKLWEGGFAIAEEDAPQLRGHVDLIAGDELVARCLIVLAETAEAGVVRYEYKRRTAAVDGPALDYERPDDAPKGLLE